MYLHVFAHIDKIGKKYTEVGAHIDIVTILNTDGETDNVVTLALQALSSLITSGIYVCGYVHVSYTSTVLSLRVMKT